MVRTIAMHCGRVNETMALMLKPWYVASDESIVRVYLLIDADRVESPDAGREDPMRHHKPRDPDFAARVRDSFDRQGIFLSTLTPHAPRKPRWCGP
jgi:hypothetical protein